MSIAIWPGTLPAAPLVDGFTAARQDNKAVFQPEVGDAKVRRRFTGVNKDFVASFDLTATQRDALDTFHDSTLQDGVLPFTWTDPQNGVSGTFRFTAPPSWSALGGNGWKASCQLRRID